jgi:FMN phosphatase YigB (HAD superfamily)
MAYTLEQYADFLDTRKDLNWPAHPAATPVKAKPYLEALEGVRAVTWNVYGTLLCLLNGELLWEHPEKFVTHLALDKTIQEFKMWKAMTRKPGQPAEYMHLLFKNALTDLQLRAAPPGEKHPEPPADKIWENIVKKLLANEYTFDTSFYGSLDDYCRKIAYFYHASLQGTACYDGAVSALWHVRHAGKVQGIIADGQIFTAVQLARGLREQGAADGLDALLDKDVRAWSYEVNGRRPSERLFRAALAKLEAKGIEAHETLHVGSSITKDVVPAKKLGMRTALFAGDKASLDASKAQLKDPETQPDVLLTDLRQMEQVIA